MHDLQELQRRLNESVRAWANYQRRIFRSKKAGELIGHLLLRSWEDFESAAADGGGAEMKS